MADKKRRSQLEDLGSTIIALPERKDLLARNMIQIQTTNCSISGIKEFFLPILKEEDVGEFGHEFKLQLIKQPSYSYDSSSLRAFGYAEFDEYIASTLLDYDIVNFKIKTYFPGEQIEKHRIFSQSRIKKRLSNCLSTI